MRYVKKLARLVIDRFQHTPSSSSEKLGNKEAAWCIDPDKLSTSTRAVLFSGGAGNDISFETEFIRRFNGEVFLYDPSPTGLRTVTQVGQIAGLTFIPKALTGKSGKIKMAAPTDFKEGSWRVAGSGVENGDEFEAVSLLEDIRRRGYSKVDVIKLDIEGFEYDVLEEILNSKILVTQILVEFHDFFPSVPTEKTTRIRKLLKQKGYQCFYKKHYDFSFFLNSSLME